MTNRAGDGLYKTSDGGLTWRRTEPKQLPLPQPSIPADSILSGWQSEDLGWSVASTGSCSGEKSTPSFTCQVVSSLEQTLDSGQTWSMVPLP